MGDAVDVAEGAVGISTWVWVILVLLGLSAGGLFLYHHHVYNEGYSGCLADFKAADDKQKAAAQIEIAKIGDKYAQIDKDMQKSADFTHPASPLIVAAVASMPSPHHGAKRPAGSVRPSGATVGAGN